MLTPMASIGSDIPQDGLVPQQAGISNSGGCATLLLRNRASPYRLKLFPCA